MSSVPDHVTNVKLGKHDRPIEFDFTDFQYTPLGRLVIYRLRNNYDLKVIMTGDVGKGKTALAVSFARWVRKMANAVFDERHMWNVEEHAGLDIWNYLEAYRDAQPGDCLVIDELQESADSRRAMSKENVFLSWAWMKLRVRQVVSVGVLPSPSALDGRLEELADVWIHIYDRGKAVPYYLKTEPFPPYKTYRNKFQMGDFFQVIRWPDLAGDDDYERLHKMKMDSGVPGVDSEDVMTESDVKEQRRKWHKEVAQRGLKKLMNGGIETQSDLADLIDVHRSTITDYKKELEADA